MLAAQSAECHMISDKLMRAKEVFSLRLVRCALRVVPETRITDEGIERSPACTCAVLALDCGRK